MDPIADMLTSIRNALLVQRSRVEVPFSNIKYEIAKILEEKGFVEKVEKKGRKTKKIIEITLKYLSDEASAKEDNNKIPAISGLKKISKLGQRIYFDSGKIKKVKDGYGIAIISTSKGLMTDQEARKNKVGGEMICEIW